MHELPHAARTANGLGNVISMTDILQRRQEVKALDILVAEDNPVNQEVIFTILRQLGHRVCLAEDGEKALDALSSDTTFDLVLLDMNMPKVSGLEVLKQFRFMDTSGNVPVLMLSADALQSTISDCMQAGANDYITKPVQMATLLEKIAELGDSDVHSEIVDIETQADTEPDRVLNENTIDVLFSMIISQHKRQHLFHSFLSNGKEYLAKLDTLAQQEQTSQFLDHVHGFKGSAAILGVQSVVSVCIEIEPQRARLDGDAMVFYTAQLRQAFQQGCSALQAYMKRVNV